MKRKLQAVVILAAVAVAALGGAAPTLADTVTGCENAGYEPVFVTSDTAKYDKNGNGLVCESPESKKGTHKYTDDWQPCEPGFDWVRAVWVEEDPEPYDYSAYDKNGNGQICVATTVKKNGSTRITDDVLAPAGT
jgi:hypothetical protein